MSEWVKLVNFNEEREKSEKYLASIEKRKIDLSI